MLCRIVQVFSALLFLSLQKVYGSDMEKKMAEELQARINNRETEYCRFGLEIHFNMCGESKQSRPKRSPFWRRRRRRSPPPPPRPSNYCNGYCACNCNFCGITGIIYG